MTPMREHRRSARRRDQDQGFHGRLPFRGLMLGLRQLHNVGAGVLQRDELALARQRDWIIETTFPAAVSHSRASPAACARADRSDDISRRSNPADRAGE